VHDDERRVGRHARGIETRGDGAGRRQILRDLDWVARATGRRHAERRQQIPLVFDGVPRRHERARPRHARRVHPPAAGHVVADALPRPARERQPRAARAAVKVDDEIEALGPQRARQREIVRKPPQSAPAFRHEHAIEMWIVNDDGSSLRFDEIREVRLRKTPPNGGHGRRRKDHVADQTEPDE
jgi:hypothetical protein